MEKNIFKKTEGILYNYKQIKAEIENLQLEIAYLKNNFEGVGSITYEEKTGETNKISNMIEREIVDREKKFKYLERALNEKEKLMAKVDNALRVLNEKEREIVTLKCIDDNPWEYVITKTYLRQSRASEIKNKAIIKLANTIFVNETLRIS